MLIKYESQAPISYIFVLSKGHRSAVKYFFKNGAPVLIINVLTC